jgi:hypothetical protein
MAGTNELFLQRLDSGDSIRPVATGNDATYGGAIADTLLFIMTDADAPMGKVSMSRTRTGLSARTGRSLCRKCLTSA